MIKYIPDSKENIEKMLKEIGVKSIDDLFEDIPASVRLNGEIGIGKGVSEWEAYKKLKDLSNKNNIDYINFLGFGSYDHIIPSVVHSIIGRSEFYTAYTPYQAEISQGILQAIFEYQTVICQITGMDASNASLYDGATSAYEAVVMGLQNNKNGDEILFSSTIHPFTKEVLNTTVSDLGLKLIEIEEEDGQTSLKDLKEKLTEKTAAVIIQTPNIYGIIEDLTGFADEIHKTKALFVISSNPLSLAHLKSQREWGADIAIGDLQPAGIPQYFGGPSAGYIATKMEHVRKLPGRIVGQTVDRDGKRAFVLTLQAREQHIKREKATSNICSNQALAALSSLVYFVSIGKEGYKEVSRQNFAKSHYLFDRLTDELNLKPYSKRPFFNEFAIDFGSYEKAKEFLNYMEENKIMAGIMLSDILNLTPFSKKLEEQKKKEGIKDNSGVIVVACTEKRTKDEIDLYIDKTKNFIKK